MFIVLRDGVKLVDFGRCPAGSLIQNGDDESSLGIVTRDAERSGVVWLSGRAALTFTIFGPTAAETKFIHYPGAEYAFQFFRKPIRPDLVNNGTDYSGLIAIDDEGMWLVVRQLRSVGYDVRRLRVSDWTMHSPGDTTLARYVSSWDLLVGLPGAVPREPRIRVAEYCSDTRDDFWSKLPNQ